MNKLPEGIAAIIFTLMLLLFSFPYSPELFAAEKTIGFIMTGDIPYYNRIHAALVQKLRKEGYADRVRIILQKPYPEIFSWMNAARKLIAEDSDIIVAYGVPATSAVINERSKTPLVYGGVFNSDAISIGSGKYLTGSLSKVPVSSLIRYLKGMVTITNIGVIFSASDMDCVRQVEEIETLGAQMGFSVTRINLKSPYDADKITGRMDAIFITSSSVAHMAIKDIISAARRYHKPAVSILSGNDDAGIVIVLSADPEKKGEILAEKVIKILNGTHPERISVDTATEIELIVNMKEISSAGLRVPIEAVSEATRIIY